MNNVPGSIPNSLVAATQPNIKGMAPGMAPTKTEIGVFVFKGVYILVYKKIDTAPNIAVLGLIEYKIAIPARVKITAIINAELTDILPDGHG